MNYFPFHIGDYISATAHLTFVEDAAYRRLLDSYYAKEAPLPADIQACCRLVRAQSKAEKDAVKTVLAEFFVLVGDVWTHKRCDAELAKMQDKQNKAKRSANARWKPEPDDANADANALRTQSEGNAPNTNTNTNTKKEDKATLMVSGEGLVIPTPAQACLALKAAGLSRVNPSSPDLAALLESGVTIDELVLTASESHGKGSPFAWTLATVKKRREEALKPSRSTPEPAWRTEQKNRTLQAVPGIAAVHQRAANVIELEVGNVPAITVG